MGTGKRRDLTKTLAAASAVFLGVVCAHAKTVVVADMPHTDGGNREFFSKAAAGAGLDIEFRKCVGKDWEKESTYGGADVVVFTGGWHDSTFRSAAARKAMVKFVASGKGALLTGFRCGPVRNGAPPLFPSIGTIRGAHPLTPWVQPVGDGPLAAAFSGKTLNFGGFDSLGLSLGPDATPFAQCSGITVGAYGPCGLGRAVLLGVFTYGGGELKDEEGSLAVMSAILRHLASSPEASETERSAAVARELAAVDRRAEIDRLTFEGNGPSIPHGIIPAARDAAVVPVESRQLLLEFFERRFREFGGSEGLDVASLANECGEMAKRLREVAEAIRRLSDEKCREAVSGISGRTGESGTLGETGISAEFAALAAKAPMAEAVALIAKARVALRAQRKSEVAAERAEDLKTLPVLVSRLSSPLGAVRLEAATELGRIGEATPEVVEALVAALGDPDDKVAVQAVTSLAWMRAKGAVDALIAKVSDPGCEEHVRRRAAQALGQIGDRKAIPALMPLLGSRDRWLRENAIISLGWLKATEAVPTLAKYAKGEGIPEHDGRFGRGAWEHSAEYATRECAITALGDIGDKSAVQALEGMPEEFANAVEERWRRYRKPHIFSCAGLGTSRLAKDAIAKIEAGGRAETGVRQPSDLSSRRYFYALTKENNALAGRFYWTMPHIPAFKDKETHALLLPYLLDAGCTGFHDGWEPEWSTGEDSLVDLIRECDELGLVAVEQAYSSSANDFCDVLKGSQNATFELLGDVPLYQGCWSEEWWPAMRTTGKDLDAWLRRKYGDGYRETLGFSADQDPLARDVWDIDNIDGGGDAKNYSPNTGADHDRYEPGVNRGAFKVAIMEKTGEDLEERWREAQDWLSCRRKAFNMTYSLTDGLIGSVSGGQRAQERIGVFGPETYQACGRGNVFMIEYSRNGLPRPVMTEFYNMYSLGLAHDLRGFCENAMRAKCFFPFVLSQIFKFHSSYGPAFSDINRWNEFCKVYRHVRDNRDLYAVSPSATEVAVAVSERSTAMFACQNRDRATLQNAGEQRGCAVYAALAMSHIYGDALNMEVADEERLAKYKVLFLVNAKLLTEREQGLLRKWVADGGTLVCDGATSLFDAKNLELRGDYAIADLLGVGYKRTDFAPTRDVWQYGVEKGGKHPFRLRQGFGNPWRFKNFVYRDFKPSDCVVSASGVEYDASLGIDRVELRGAKAVQTFADGSPALTVNEYGRGRVYFFAANAPSLGHVASEYESQPNKYAFWPGVRETYEKIAREGLARAGTVQAVEPVDAPEELDFVVYSQKGGDRLVVHLLDRDEKRESLSGVSLKINGARAIKRVYRAGGGGRGKDVDLPVAADRTVELGVFDVFDMIVVDFL